MVKTSSKISHDQEEQGCYETKQSFINHFWKHQSRNVYIERRTKRQMLMFILCLDSSFVAFVIKVEQKERPSNNKSGVWLWKGLEALRGPS